MRKDKARREAAAGRHCRWKVQLCICALLLLPATGSLALLGDRIQAGVDLTAIQSDTDGSRNESFRQNYNARFMRQLLPYITLGGSYRYYKFDLAQEEVSSLWQEETLPRAELTWRHPHFNLGAMVSRRDMRSLVSLSDLRTDSFQFSFRTRDTGYPLATITYDWLQSRETGAGVPRDTRDRRLQAGLSYSHEGSNLGYTLLRRLTENLLPGLEIEQLDHSLRWSSSMQGLAKGRVQLATHYTFNRSVRSDRILGAGEVLEKLEVAAALFSLDPSPEFGELEAHEGLADGDLLSATDPPVDLGGAHEHWNLGADLGFVRPVSAIYLYTDRASGSGQLWDVYTSEDNLVWTRSDFSAAVLFNLALSRFEIVFDSVRTRYVKAVNSGLNEVAEVFATEIEIYQTLGQEERQITRDSQRASLRANLRLSDRGNVTADLSYQQDPGAGLVGRRIGMAWALAGRYEQAAWLSHLLRWEESRQNFTSDGEDILDRTAGYTLKADPLETLGASLGLARRLSYADEELDQEFRSASFQVQGQPAWGLEMASSLLRSRTILHRADREYDTWAFRSSLGGALTRSLDFRFSYALQDTRSVDGGLHRRRHLWGVEYSYRLNRTLFSSGRLNLIEDVDRSVGHDYNITWNPSPDWSLSGLANFSDSEGGLETRRYSLGLNYDITRNSSLYTRFSVTDLSRAGGSRTTSLQQGFRARF